MRELLARYFGFERKRWAMRADPASQDDVFWVHELALIEELV